MKRKLLIIGGPTAVGKTKLALALGEKYNGELLSADSRQVYKGLDIGTGKDLPKNSKFKFRNSELGGVYEIEGIDVWGLDLVDPKEEFDVSKFVSFAHLATHDIWERGKLPILVGGSGFYVKALLDGIDTLGVPRNESLRDLASHKTVPELFSILTILDRKKAEGLNESDRKNPARLIRAIEVAEYRKAEKDMRSNPIDADILYIGLTAPKEIREEKIEKRVYQRFENGLLSEIEGLLGRGLTWDMQSMNTLGYKEWRAYFEKTKGKDEVIREWIIDEKKYAKRQITWFNKEKRIVWFDTTNKEYPLNVEMFVNEWHNTTRSKL